MSSLISFVESDSGVTAIEYGLIAAAIGFMLITLTPFLRDPLAAILAKIVTGFTILSSS